MGFSLWVNQPRGSNKIIPPSRKSKGPWTHCSHPHRDLLLIARTSTFRKVSGGHSGGRCFAFLYYALSAVSRRFFPWIWIQ